MPASTCGLWLSGCVSVLCRIEAREVAVYAAERTDQEARYGFGSQGL